ncbi:Spy/CpxP family protein refolding chaperone [uncultured Duncaniella sp.]|uniref:Spy/CpxP family protein refolding chaperone n=1 Tax=uncultured Duncaniella sp. TaxID=2768039 RepID=UPI00260246E1|nr:Spy/CpxP family protein refolding chaperone [uncultured Duncaniella sp.]
MRHIALSIILVLSAIILPISAQAQRPSGREREVWMKEMQQFKNDFIAKKLNLTEEQKAKFLPLYNSMDEEIRKAQNEAEQLYRQTLKKGEKATDLEYEKAAEAVYELKGRENTIEMKYFNDYKQILSPNQLFQLKVAERDFTRQLMKQHRSQRKAK